MCVYNTFFYGSGFTTLIRFNYWIVCETVLPDQGDVPRLAEVDFTDTDTDDRFYNKLDKDPTKQFSDEITNEPITQVDRLSLLTVIPLNKSQDLWISTFVNMLKLFHLLSNISLTTYNKWQL